MHVESHNLCRAMRTRSPDELGYVSIEPVDRIRRLGTGGKNPIFLFMVVDTNHTCGLDGTQVLSRDG